MTFDYLLGVLVADGSLTGDKVQPSIQIKMRDYSYDLLLNIQKNFGGKLYGPYANSKNSMSNGDMYQIMWRGNDLRPLINHLENIDITLYDTRFNQKYQDWKNKYFMYFSSKNFDIYPNSFNFLNIL